MMLEVIMYLEELIANNQFPMLFIGSGIPKRYVEGFPTWTSLLEHFWNLAVDASFYGKMNELTDRYKGLPEPEISFRCNTEMASYIEDIYNEKFNEGKIEIPSFTQKDAYINKTSPFKVAISKHFEKINLANEKKSEIKKFAAMLNKAQVIFTTNYDQFIEKAYELNEIKITKYVGNTGFFSNTYNYSELYKIHGCITEPKQIIITDHDYNLFNSKSILISSKIVSLLMGSPLIFMGYSLTDLNIRKIIKKVVESLTEKEIALLEERLILVEYLKGENQLREEVLYDKDLGCKFKIIKTDNYERIYDVISSIDQGLSPYMLRKFNSVIKEIIIDNGKKGMLNAALVSLEDIDKISEDRKNSNIVVAIGDDKTIFQIPDLASYCIDYISEKDEINNEIRLRFASQQTGRIPFCKFMKEEIIQRSNLYDDEKIKLLDKLKSINSKKTVGSINMSSVVLKETYTIAEILSVTDKKSKIHETISYNIKRIYKNDVKDYILQELQEIKKSGNYRLKTELRRLMLIYDLQHNYKEKE